MKESDADFSNLLDLRNRYPVGAPERERVNELLWDSALNKIEPPRVSKSPAPTHEILNQLIAKLEYAHRAARSPQQRVGLAQALRIVKEFSP